METSFTVFERDVRIAQRHDYWLGSTCSVSRYGGSVLDRSVLIWKSSLVVAADTHPVRKKSRVLPLLAPSVSAERTPKALGTRMQPLCLEQCSLFGSAVAKVSWVRTFPITNTRGTGSFHSRNLEKICRLGNNCSREHKSATRFALQLLTDAREPRPSWRPKQSLGQNFLKDPAVAAAIVQAVRACEPLELVEIGAGTGVLTEPLLEVFPGLVALELDARAVEHVRKRLEQSERFRSEHFPELRTRIYHADFLRSDWLRETGMLTRPEPRITLVGNLPYYIVSPIFFHCIESIQRYRNAIFMVQHEFAERLMAKPKCKDYGVLSVLAQLHADIQVLLRVPRSAFYPMPKVNSVVLRLDFRDPLQKDCMSCGVSSDVIRLALHRLVRRAFQQRRKTLRNTLGDQVPMRWSRRRPEELHPAEFLELTMILSQDAALDTGKPPVSG